MKLWCRKCEKEIEEYSIERGIPMSFIYYWIIHVYCHDEKESKKLPLMSKYFNPSSYGTLEFFEKEEPEPDPMKEKEILLRAEIAGLQSNNRMLQDERDLLKKDNSQYSDLIRKLQSALDRRKMKKTELTCRIKELEYEKKQIEDELRNVLGISKVVKKAQWRRYSPPLTWTSEKPTELGMYWYGYPYENNNITIVRVFFKGDKLMMAFRGCVKTVEDAGGKWAGPIPEPIEK